MQRDVARLGMFLHVLLEAVAGQNTFLELFPALQGRSGYALAMPVDLQKQTAPQIERQMRIAFGIRRMLFDKPFEV